MIAAVAYPIVRFISPPKVPEPETDRVEAGKANDPELIDLGYKIVRFGAEPVIVIRLPEGGFRAFSAVCTHLDCIVEYQRGEKRIWCNCHNGWYDLKGQVVSGPPPKPLPGYEVHVVEAGPTQPGTVVVTKA